MSYETAKDQCIDVIEEIGPTGSYLEHEHTIRHYRDPFYSKLIDKNPYSVWLKRGGTTMEQRAATRVDEILSSHSVEPLPPEIRRDLKKVVQRQQEWFDSGQ